jgi:prepilin-type processing-associated H-X9-DG protein
MAETGEPKRRWYQYSLRTLMLFVLACSIVCSGIAVWREIGRREKQLASADNMKQIGLALQNHASSYDGTFLAHANFDKQGRPLLSWRVHTLPFYCNSALYRQFHLDEPWDSLHNKPLGQKTPWEYRTPGRELPSGLTTYQAVVGKGTMFDGDKGRSLRDVTETNAHTIIAVETDDDHAVIWTKPEDWEYDPEHPMAGLGHAHRGGFNVLMGDGSVRLIDRSVDPDTFKAMLTPADGNAPAL